MDVSYASKKLSWDIGIGVYHPFLNPYDEWKLEDRYNLKNGISLYIKLFWKDFWNMPDLKHRTGIGISYQNLQGQPQINSDNFFISDRVFYMFSIWYLVQIKLIHPYNSIIITDIAGGLSLMSYKNKGGNTNICNDSFICINPAPSFGLRVGLAYMIKIKDDLAFKVGSYLQLQPLKDSVGYPFARGVIFDIGFNFNI